MDVYGLSTPDGFGIDDLLDFSNDEIFTSSTSTSTTVTTTDSDRVHRHHFPYLEKNSAGSAGYLDTLNPDYSSTDFTDDLGVPNDDIAELEWLSNFVDDSFAEFPANSITGTMDVRSETPLNSRSRSKRFRSTTAWTSAYESAKTQSSRTNCNDSNSKQKDQNSTLITSKERSASSMETVPRKCTHCASEKTPQWRTGPLGPKTLCNACGVRYKSGRLVPEYRPAASPTFVLTQHSNSHRKVLELRRQKELLRQQQPQQQQLQQQELYGHQHRHFQVC